MLQVVNPVTQANLSNVDLDIHPVIVLQCGHMFTAQFMDEYMGIADVYVMLPNGKSHTHIDGKFFLVSDD